MLQEKIATVPPTISRFYSRKARIHNTDDRLGLQGTTVWRRRVQHIDFIRAVFSFGSTPKTVRSLELLAMMLD